MSISNISDETSTKPPSPSPPPIYKLFSIRFLGLHSRDLFAASANWFLVDVVFYTSNFLVSHIFSSYSHKPSSSATTNVYDATFEVAKLGAIRLLYHSRLLVHSFLHRQGFMVLYGLVFFFCNFGPNTTTFIIPAELFPARFRSTCHVISGAAGKLGAIVGTVGFLWATKKVEDGDDINQVYPNANRMRTVFLILGGVCIVGMFVTYFFTKETMGRSLEENEHERDNNVEDEDIVDWQSLGST
ncbi:hypothetical protein F2Q68_00014279 [Brassica cretica]|uniref:Major facilitator superfamily (MFS) profile domain-containing protein n=1 Tax=Brassica cretica TaxID=69181 RepID=A0A8S9HKE5_BRACR|nr:hypothetical protein F2Q68_00014279 [Brassica cretica]